MNEVDKVNSYMESDNMNKVDEVIYYDGNMRKTFSVGMLGVKKIEVSKGFIRLAYDKMVKEIYTDYIETTVYFTEREQPKVEYHSVDELTGSKW
jgi:hypothetical protein